MRKRVLAVLIMGFVLSGCGTTMTTQTSDRMGMPMAVTQEKSFFASENLAMHYEYNARRNDSHAAAVQAKIDAVKENSVRRMSLSGKVTATELLLAGVIDSLTIAAIPVDPAPLNERAPKTMAETWGSPVEWGNLLLNTYNTVGGGFNRSSNRSKNDGDDYVNINNSGAGDVFWKSSNNKNPVFTIDNGSSGAFDLGGRNDRHDSIDSHDTTDYPVNSSN